MIALVLLLAVLAGIRSLWSPCGLSVAETIVAPGRERRFLRALLSVAMVSSASAFGLVAGVLWRATLPALGVGAALAIVGLSLLADLVHRVTGKLAPLAVGRQLPIVYGRRLPQRWAAVLYGLRLGVAPLTIVMTWQWWAAAVLAASLGPAASVATGAVFACTRAVAMVLAVRGADSGASAGRSLDAVLDRAPRAWIATTLTAAAAAVVVFSLGV